MKWTTTKPTVEGYYWVRAQGDFNGVTTTVVKVYASRKHSHVDYVYWADENFSINSERFQHWSDQPIPEPT
jgi:hypothetical protein